MGDLSYAFRMLRKAPLASGTIVLTVALGLGMVAAVFTIVNVFLFRVDAVPNVHEMYAVERPRNAEGDLVPFTRPMFDAVKRENTAFTGVFAMVAETDSRVHGRTMNGSLVTGSFFEVLGVSAVKGRVLTPADDDGRNPVVVLSDRGWASHFGGDPAVIGRRMPINGVDYEVVGVMPKGFRGLMMGAPDYWAPLSLIDRLQPALVARNKDVEIAIVGRLKPGLSREVAQAQLAAWDAARAPRAAERGGATIVLTPRQGTAPQPMEVVIIFTPIFIAFGLILLIGCANVASLLLARAMSRQKEIGVRLSLGASRGQIVRQLLIESFVMALAAAVLAYGISRVILETTVWAVMTTMPPDIGDVRLLVPDSDWHVAVFLFAGALAASVMFGLIPALQATRLELVRTMRGEIVRDARPGRMRNVLIGMQVTASALLLICSAIFLRSSFESSILDPGLRINDTAIVPVSNEALRGPVVDALARDPLVAAISASMPYPVGSLPALAESAAAQSPAAYLFVSPEHFSVLGVNVVRGRPFRAAENSVNAAVVIVSDSLALQLWPDIDPLGQVLRLLPDPAAPAREGGPPAPTGHFLVVGVARDVKGIPIAEIVPANVYLPISARDTGTTLTVRVRGDSELARRALMDRLTAVDPSIEPIVTLKTMAGMATYFLQLAFWFTLVLGALALVLTLSGLFSVLSYLVEQRRKEIGVRMALGATAKDVGELIMVQTIWPVVVGLVIGNGIAVALATVLLASPLAASVGQLVRVLDPLSYVGSLLVILLACLTAALLPSLQAARVNPVQSLRQE